MEIVPAPLDSREVVRRFLRLQVRTRTIGREVSSYGWKHRVEQWASISYGTHVYISNTEFIEVAAEMHIPSKPIGDGSPNWWFALSPKGWPIL